MRRKQGRLKPGGIVFSPKGAEDNSAGKDAATEEKDANTEKADANTEDTDANTNAKTRDSKERERGASTEVPARNERLKHACDQEDKRRTRNTRQSESAGKVSEKASSSNEEKVTHSKTEKLLLDNTETVPQVCCGRTQAVHIRRYDFYWKISFIFCDFFLETLSHSCILQAVCGSCGRPVDSRYLEPFFFQFVCAKCRGPKVGILC